MLFHVHAMENYKGIVHSLESFGSVDGPGVRFVVFMQGCKMRCKYCHNPETWSFDGGVSYSAEELFEQAWKYRAYWGKDMKNGGVTVSGGEPLLQIEFVTEFFKILKSHNIHTTVDTSGQPFCEDAEYLKKFDELLKYTDLVLLDLKIYDGEEHRELTGHNNDNILKMAQYLSDKGVSMWIRHVLVPGITDSEENLTKLSQFIMTLKTVEKVEVLPYHTLGLSKWKKLKIPYSLEGVRAPSVDEIAKAQKILGT